MVTNNEAALKLYDKLSNPDVFLINYFIKHWDQPQRDALDKIIHEFEMSHKRDWTDFVHDALIEANANQN